MKRTVPLAVMLCSVGCSPPTTPVALLPLPLAPLAHPPQPTIIAHRGGAGMGPEATLATMRRSLQAGATVLELDVHLTRDGVPVLLHDATVDRTTNGSGAVSELLYDDLRQLDAGDGAPIPHLAEPLRAFPTTPFLLELKGDHPDLVAETLAVLRDEDALSRVILASFHTDRLEAARAIPEAPATGLSTTEVLEWLWHGDQPEYRPPASFAQLPPEVGGFELLTPERLGRAARVGLTVQAWTINDGEQAIALTRAGVAGIITDHPDRICAALGPSCQPDG